MQSNKQITSHMFYNNDERLAIILKQAKRNGYLSQIKQLAQNSSTQHSTNLDNSYDIGYRNKAKSYYGKKISKPFKLMQQPQYMRQLRFNTDFRAFVKSIPQFQAIKQDNPNDINNKFNSTTNNKYYHNNKYKNDDDTLIYDPCKNCDVSPQNIKKRMLNSIDHYYAKSQQLQNDQTLMFPTKINLVSNVIRMNRKMSKQKYKQKNDNQSRIDIALNSGGRSISQISPKKSQNQIHKSLQKSKNSYNSKLRTNRTKLGRMKTGISSIQIRKANLPYINQNIALQYLNKLIGTDHKLKNYRISKQKLLQIMTKKYRNDIIINFFGIQLNQDYEGIIKFITQILLCDDKLAQLLTFLTIDYNKDGVITQDQLIQFKNIIDIDSAINQDINMIIAYAKNNGELKCQADLPLHFINYPTYKEYRKIVQNVSDQPADKIRGIYRLFSLKMENQQGNKVKQQFETLNKHNQALSKRKIRINFEHFQKIFSKKGHPKFISQYVGYLIGKDHKRIQQLSPKHRRMSINVSGGKKFSLQRRNTMGIDPRIFLQLLNVQKQQSHLSKAQKLLKILHKDKKSLTTVQFD